MDKDKHLIIGGIILCIIIIVSIFLFQINEDFPIGTLPNTNCNTKQLGDISTDINTIIDPILATSELSEDTVTTDAYKNALATYKAALDSYNKLQSCNPMCIGGSVDINGNCICKDGTPYIHSDGKIYCVPVDFTSVPNAVFDSIQPKFMCSPGYSQTNFENGDSMCYNTSNTTLTLSYIKQLVDATAAINNVIKSAYGKVGNFYISGQSNIPSALKQISQVKNIKTFDCANNAPTDATVFVYNPQTQTCTYYTGSAALSNLSVGNYTVGTTTL